MSLNTPLIYAPEGAYFDPNWSSVITMTNQAFSVLPNGTPDQMPNDAVRVIKKRLSYTNNRPSVGQSFNGSMNEPTITSESVQLPTYLMGSRFSVTPDMMERAARNKIPVVNLLQDLVYQGMMLSACGGLISGFGANEGLINAPEAIREQLPPSSTGATSWEAWDAGELAQYLLNLAANMRTENFVGGDFMPIVVLMPQKFYNRLSSQIVQLTDGQRPGGGYMTTGTLFRSVMESYSGNVVFAVSDDLLGLGTAGQDLIMVVSPRREFEQKGGFASAVTAMNRLNARSEANLLMYMGSTAPVRYRGIYTDANSSQSYYNRYDWRVTSGYALRGKAITLLSAKYN